MALPSTFGQALGRSQSQALQDFNVGQSVRELAYKAFVVAQEQGILVEAWLPETVGIDVNASYDPPYAQGLGALSGAQGLSEFARFLGVSLTTQALTAQIWQGGAFIDFTLPMVFQAEASAAADVMLPIQRLLSLTMPKDPSGGGLLEAPGPRIDLKKLTTNGREALSEGFSQVKNALPKVSDMLDTNKLAISKISDYVSKAKDTVNKPAQTLSSALVNSVTNNISLYVGQFLYFPSVVITDVSPTYDVLLSKDKNPMRATVNVVFKTFYMPTDRDIKVMFPSAEGFPIQNQQSRT